MSLPSYEEIKRGGWDTPAAEYWKDMFEKLEQYSAGQDIRVVELERDLAAARDREAHLVEQIEAFGMVPKIQYKWAATEWRSQVMAEGEAKGRREALEEAAANLEAHAAKLRTSGYSAENRDAAIVMMMVSRIRALAERPQGSSVIGASKEVIEAARCVRRYATSTMKFERALEDLCAAVDRLDRTEEK